MPKKNPVRPDGLEKGLTQKLLVSSLIQVEQGAEPLLLQRGMPIWVQEGVEVGVVAAVVLDCRSQKATHVLLGEVPPTALYRLIPLSLIARIDGGSVWLRASRTKVESLPVRHPDG